MFCVKDKQQSFYVEVYLRKSVIEHSCFPASVTQINQISDIFVSIRISKNVNIFNYT